MSRGNKDKNKRKIQKQNHKQLTKGVSISNFHHIEGSRIGFSLRGIGDKPVRPRRTTMQGRHRTCPFRFDSVSVSAGGLYYY